MPYVLGGLAAILLGYNGGQPVNSKTKVRVAARNVVVADFGQVDHSV